MRSLILIILLFIPSFLFAEDSVYVFITDENNKPFYGYKLLETQRDDIYVSKIEPIKKWITSLKSQLIVVHNGHVYPVKDSIIIDKKQGIALLLIDFFTEKTYLF